MSDWRFGRNGKDWARACSNFWRWEKWHYMLNYTPLTGYLCLATSRDMHSEQSNHTTEDA